jgi:hypothetical protein
MSMSTSGGEASHADDHGVVRAYISTFVWQLLTKIQKNSSVCEEDFKVHTTNVIQLFTPISIPFARGSQFQPQFCPYPGGLEPVPGHGKPSSNNSSPTARTDGLQSTTRITLSQAGS